jgi:lipopolysaccharide transport system ATP-binding protein
MENEERDSADVLDAATERDDWLIRASGLRKKYCRDLRKSLWYGFQDVLAALWRSDGDPEVLREHEFWAVDNVSFELRRGDGLGLLGRNGAGKSTLLKIITGQRSLTAGTVATRGRVVALTELGLGFNPVLTGRENAYVNASIFGVSRREFDKLIEKIIDFSELREFIDSAVYTYSTGMKARLGFAVATYLSPDILIVDEVLAVGDLEFRRKCVQHVLTYIKNGGSVILVAHDPYLVQSVCNRAIILDRGKAVFQGSAVDGVDLHFRLGHMNQYASVFISAALAETGPVAEYQGEVAGENDGAKAPIPRPLTEVAEFPDNRPVIIDQIEIVPVEGDTLQTGKPAKVIFHYRSRIDARVIWAFTLSTADLQVAIASCTHGMDGEDSSIVPGTNELACLLPELVLRPGVFAIRGGIGDAVSRQALAVLGYENSPAYFTVEAPKASHANNWQLLQNDLVTIKVKWLS